MIKRTLYRCARAMDYGHDAQELTDCFREDGIWWWASSETRLEGSAELEQHFVESASTRGRPGNFTHHMLWNTLIELEGDRATAESYTATLAETPEGPLVRSMGRYRDLLVRCADGVWRIQNRKYVCESEVRVTTP